MAIKPILFNMKMVREILDGRKSCTRRIVKHDVGAILNSPYNRENPDVDDKQIISKLCIPPYQPGDILYVRETWKKAPNGYYYYEDWQKNDIADITKWHPSIHMPKEAARIWLKVMDVRVERLQEMKPVDVIKEGAYPDCWDCLNTYGESGSQCCYGTEEQCSQCDEVMREWEKLWNATIKNSDLDRYGWNANPWVWIIEFERCEKPKEESEETQHE